MSEILLINKIFNVSAERKATDIHLVVGSHPVIRTSGRLMTLNEEKVLTPSDLNGIIESFLSPEELIELTREREIVSVYSWANRLRFRVRVFYQKGYLAASFRLIPSVIKSPQELGLPKAITKLLTKSKGLIIITGPYGSGRTTSVMSLLETLNRNKGLHIQTLENPVEYLLVNNQSIIEQRQINRDTLSFMKGLSDTEGEDIDVLFISSLREKGEEEKILELAESGRLIILIMDADSVVSALERFVSNISKDRRDWGQDQLADVILGVLSQRILPRIGGGTTLAYEILTSTPAVQSTIKENRLYQLNSIMQTSKDEGMINLDNSLLELVRVSEISQEDARINALNPQIFKKGFRYK